jgi:hypothetical protein
LYQLCNIKSQRSDFENKVQNEKNTFSTLLVK